MRCVQTAKLKEGKTFTYSKGANLLDVKKKKKEKLLLKASRGVHSSSLTSVKRSPFTPAATRPQLQGNQTHLFSAALPYLLTAAFSPRLAEHQVASFSWRRRGGSDPDTAMTLNIHAGPTVVNSKLRRESSARSLERSAGSETRLLPFTG